MNKIDCISELRGEYNIKVLENKRTVFSSGWCKNTILSGGLVNLYNNDISSLTNILDLGKSSSLPGSQGYGLKGVIQPADTPLLNIPRSRHSVFSESDGVVNNATRVFYSYFASDVSTTDQTLSEFAIRSSSNIGGFARNVFSRPVNVQRNQYIILEYILKVNRRHTLTTKLPFKTSAGHSFTVPITGVSFNIPYNEMYRNDNELILLKENTPLPAFGTNWPVSPNFAINNKAFSTFTSTEIGRGLNNTTRSYSVSTVFYNISAKPYGLFNQINTIALGRNSQITFNNGLVNDRFLAIRMSFPLSLYNYENNFFDINGITSEVVPNTTRPLHGVYDYRTYSTTSSRYNKLDLYFNYTWSEVS